MLLRTRRILSLPSLLLAATLVATLAPQAATATPITHATVVKDNPADYTPNIQDGAGVTNAATYAILQSGQTMFIGGAFRTVTNSTRTTTYTRYNVMSFALGTGAVQPLAPNFNGEVWGFAATGTSLYVAGSFTTVNGVARRGIAKINGITGVLDTAFNAGLPSGKVGEVKLVNNRLIIGGTFPKRLAALNPATGADTNYINIPIAGTLAANAGEIGLYRFAINPAGTRLVAIGNFTTVGGKVRYRAFMLNLNAASAALNNWDYVPLRRMCYSSAMPEYLRDVDFSPNGQYFAVVATGTIVAKPADLGTSICDAAARFETEVPAPAKPTWINYTGGDTLHSVAITGAAVYVQGHQRWLDNPQGYNTAGPGAVSRQGIGAINPTTGKALPWNPTKEGGIGGKDLYVTTAGLWVGSDTRYIHNEWHDSIALMPL
jgi:hypothetical protein